MSMIDRAGAASLIPEEISSEIISGVRANSVAMQLFRRLPNMTAGVEKMPVLSMLPVADFVNGDSGMKVTTNAEWDKKMMVAGEIAAIVPIPQAVLDDSSYDIWEQVKPLLTESFGRIFDNQVFNGGNPKAPTDWPTALIPGAIAAGQTVEIDTGTDLLADLNDLYGMLEEMGYEVTGLAAQKMLKTALRGLRDNNGQFIYTTPTADAPATVYSVPSHFVRPGTFDKNEAIAIAGDFTKSVYSIRQDMTFQIFDTGVISDDTGAVVYNLLQQDMVALRAVMRLAWQVANPIDIDRAGTEYPFAVLTPAA